MNSALLAAVLYSIRTSKAAAFGTRPLAESDFSMGRIKTIEGEREYEI